MGKCGELRSSVPISGARIRQLFTYSHETGQLRRSVFLRPSKSKKTVVARYRKVRVDGSVYPVHRLVWLYLYDEWPSCQIDHINGDTNDNRAVNLRLATVSQNVANQPARVYSLSGIRGVWFSKKKKKWIARCMVGGKRFELGRFDCASKASEAYRKFHIKKYAEFSVFCRGVSES